VTKDAVVHAFRACNAAFQAYIDEAHRTHQLLSRLSGAISTEQRSTAMEQQVRENETLMRYMEARNRLFDVLTP
jgi:hypothetical protein